jgi:hypothetical protein
VADGAGLSDEQLEAVRDDRKPTRAERRAERRRTPRTRVTWRVLVFVLLLVAVVGGALATIQWYGTSTYFVTFEDGEVVIYRGRPDGILWIDPEFEEGTGIPEEDVPERFVPAIRAGNEQATLGDARQLVANIRRDIEELEERDDTTTTTTAGTTTTRAP